MTTLTLSGRLRAAAAGAGLALFCLGAGPRAAGQTPPLEFRQRDLLLNPESALLPNWQSAAGVPLSSTNGVPLGSDGRAPTVSQQTALGLTTAPPSPRQFQSLLSFGAIPVQGTRLLNTNLSFVGNADALNWPRGKDSQGNLQAVLRSAHIGGAFLGQQVSFLFGSVIPVPSTDEHGVTLTNIAKETYWLPQPFTTNNYTNAPFYWSSNARAVFATQAGGVDITWIKAAPLVSAPVDLTNYVSQSGVWYRLYTQHYLVSGAPVKPPQKMFWTEGPFAGLGKTVTVPPNQVTAVNVVYSDAFPRRVAHEYVDPDTVLIVETNRLEETRTLWLDTLATVGGAIRAYNVEGRVFVELLGQLNADGISRQYLGFEIVDVFKQPSPQDVTVELGERMYPFQDRDDPRLYASPSVQVNGDPFYYQQSTAGNDHLTVYATRETRNLNDFQMYWLIGGVAGLRWPYMFVRYHEVWPSNVARYSHYLRPQAASEAEAMLTAVQLPAQDGPVIQYQDPLDQPRAKLTGASAFYTYLIPAYPAHRTLLRFALGNQVAFERVFSWLDTALETPTLFAGSVATNLTAWNPAQLTLNLASSVFTAPRIVNQTVNVADRILPPSDETWNGTNYQAGYILQTNGTSFDPAAYADPFVAGFQQANQSSIIPVNAIPGQNQLEVWWFRPNSYYDGSYGQLTTYWPAIIGHYTLQWPAAAPEIILASNAGSGPLDSVRARGSIYYQNDPGLPGYNPNEEHAVMQGGQVYALRDDLNLTNVTGYSSAPYVLLSYVDTDGRPSMTAFHVRREKPEAGIFFDYVVDAGRLLQAPMPLPLLEKPIEGSGPTATNYDAEPPVASGDFPVGWTPANVTSQLSYYRSFTFQDRKHEFWVYRGPHGGMAPFQAGQYNATNDSFGPLPAAAAVVGAPFVYYIHTSRRTDSLTVAPTPFPTGLTVSNGLAGLAIAGIPVTAGSNYLTLTIEDTADNSVVTNYLSLIVQTNGTVVSQGPLSISCSNQYSGNLETFTNRPPQLAAAPTTTNSFTMRYYYKTIASFAWPGVANPPAAGAIVPYLRPRDPVSGNFVGDPAAKTTPSLNIVYRPAWPALVNGANGPMPVPTLSAGETLADARHGLAAVRGQGSAQVLYQQSIGLDFPNAPASVVLCDPTVEKTSKLPLNGLAALPSSIQTVNYQGHVFFPNLPPHLVNRVYFDPNSTNLVLQGQYVNETVGDSYLLLNVLRGADLAAVNNICFTNDQNYSAWTNAVGALRAPVYSFYQNPASPGSYVANTNLTYYVGVGDLVGITNSDAPVDSYALSSTGPGFGYVTYLVGNSLNPAHAGDPVSVYVARVAPPLYPGQVKVLPSPNPLSELVTFQHSVDLAGRSQDYLYEWRIAAPVNGAAPTNSPEDGSGVWTLLAETNDLPHFTLGGAGIQELSDNYVTLRYRSVDPLAPAGLTNWSAWTTPVLAEGWIKRVLAGINPFNQRTSDLFNNPANTTASIIAQAGTRWEGDVALNPDTLNNHGLIEIYETVLNRGKNLSINSGINYGPANDALLLAAGYLNDLYMILGNEAWANAANPTIGIGTDDKTYGSIATALFTFKGEVASLLEQDLALLRGRDDFMAPGTALKPVYNRLFWNYTRGIDAGEVIYALNYNITDQNGDGTVNAADAAMMYPQGHGDAYGHYLTALANYYALLMNPNFDWVPRSEEVTVLGATVAVDYQDERKFAAAAAAVARAGRQTFDLTWRQAFKPGASNGWGYMAASRVDPNQSYGATNQVTEYWGLDHWCARTMAGDYLNWVVGNSILPAVDPDPTHQGIQKIDRTTVPELVELPSIATSLQTDLDNAEAGLTPLGLPQNSVPFDIDPYQITGPNPTTHFEQTYTRAVGALNNAVVAFNDAQNVTQLMRSEEDSLSSFQDGVNNQEMAYNDQLIELYGTPYPDDMGPGQTWPQGYTGPDLIHYMYVENPELSFNGAVPSTTSNLTFSIDLQQLPPDWLNSLGNFDFYQLSSAPGYSNGPSALTFNLGPNGFFGKPATWSSQRASPGSIQQAISGLIAAENALRQELSDAQAAKQALDKAVITYEMQAVTYNDSLEAQKQIYDTQQNINIAQANFNIIDRSATQAETASGDLITGLGINTGTIIVAGTAVGGDVDKNGITLPVFFANLAARQVEMALDNGTYTVLQAIVLSLQQEITDLQKTLAENQTYLTLQNTVVALGTQLSALGGHLNTINQRLRGVDDATRAYRALVAKGDRIQQERLTFRQHAAAVVQGYRVRDAAFRLFQNEKLERYQVLFDLAAKYAYLSAQAYDYETGLLNTSAGQSFINRIVSAQALGVIQNGQPQYAGSDTGDPGLSSALAEMKADWDVLKGRLGFNNPDGYGTTTSLRTEKYRILPSSDGDSLWQNVLLGGRVSDVLADADVKRYCLQIDDGSGLPVPGIILTFPTVVADGLNLFGQPLQPGDHNFSASSFATKIFAMGVDFDGYVGMDNPTGTGSTTNTAGLGPNGLAATPYVYLIPVGVDSMRSPPLGDTTTVRTWNVADIAVPLPFNISAASFATSAFWQSSDSLSEPLFTERKHQAFRPVSTTAAFNADVYANNALSRSQYVNCRLIGRSVWNSAWKLVIPGKTLLQDPRQGLDRFIQSVKDVKLYFITYSYSGN